MNRRTALKQFVFVSAGIALMPACMQDKSKASVILKNFSVTAEEEQMLAELAETIIPKTDTPGARDISAHLFALKMLDDCSSKEDQQKFLTGMHAFEDFAKNQSGASFTKAAAADRAKILTALQAQQEPKDDAAQFYTTMKRFTVQAYTTSQFYLTKVEVYELIPGRYHGCVPVNAGA